MKKVRCLSIHFFVFFRRYVFAALTIRFVKPISAARETYPIFQSRDFIFIITFYKMMRI